MKRRYTFWEIGTHKQEVALNEAQAEKALQESCNRCRYACICNERKCKIYKAYLLKLDMLKLHDGKVTVTIEFVKTRKYNYTKEGIARKQIQNLLTRYYKEFAKAKDDNYSLMIQIDNASVQVELEEYKSAIKILDRCGLSNLANQIVLILKENNLEVK